MGKSTVVYIIGLLFLVSLSLRTINEGSLGARSSFDAYYMRTMTHNRAVAGANLGTRFILTDSSYSRTITKSFADGDFSVSFRATPSGDTVRVISTATSWDPMSNEDIRDTVIAMVKRSSFSQYAYFSESEVNGYLSPTSNTPSGANMWKVTGDSLFGSAHTNGRWNLGGTPYFDRLITGRESPSTMLYNGVYAPVFKDGSRWGVTHSRPPSNLSKLEQAAISGSAVANMSFIQNNDVAMTFYADGTVNVKIPASTGTIRNNRLPISSITSTGVIGVKNGDIRVSGTYKGQVTLVALKGGGSFKGNIWIENDIVAATSPVGNSGSPDMLGLVAERMAYITKNLSRTPASVLTIHAAIYTQQGVFAAEDYTNIPLSGRIRLYGSLAMGASTATGKLTNGVLSNGFLKSFSTDPRYVTKAPPYFPRSGNYQLVTWWEK